MRSRFERSFHDQQLRVTITCLLYLGWVKLCLNSCWQSKYHFSIWQFVDTLFWFCHNMFHLPVTKYQKLTSQVQPYLAPVRFPVSLSSILSDWEITALDKQTGKHSRNYVVVLMIQEKTQNSNSESKHWSLWQHPMSQSWLWVNNLTGGGYEKFLPQKTNKRKKDK